MIQKKEIKMFKGNLLLFFAIFFFIGFFEFALVGATSQEINFSKSLTGVNNGAKFVVQTLKYEPYPVTAGSWFNVWIKVQNVGRNDAKNAEFELVPEYPFSSQNNLTRHYGLISGTINAYKQRKPGENQAQTNQIILKYRVYVDSNAKGGEHLLKIRTTSDANNGIYFIYNLPIDVEKSKVSFETAFQNYDGAQSSFFITNTGEKPAGSIVIKLNSSQWESNNGRLINLGGLDNGDSTIFKFSGRPIEKQIQLNISYNDLGGTRRSILQNISVGNIKINSKKTQGLNYLEGIIFLIGIFTGMFIIIFSRKIHKKKRGN